MWTPYILALPLVLLSLLQPFAHATDIQGISISGLGETIEEPVNEEGGSPAILRCDISGIWSTCKWQHTYLKDKSDIQVEFYCPITKGAGSASCDPEGVESVYKRRFKIEEKSSSCELKISSPNYLDSGIWECVVDGGIGTSYSQDSIEIFVSRPPEPFISEPDMESGRNQYIVLDLQDSRSRVFSKCRAYNSVPPPLFRWYISEVNPRNEINGQDVQMNDPKSRTDSRGFYTEHTLDWTPKELCKNYNIDAILCENEEFEFDLLCVIDQGEYYTALNEDNVQKVMIRVIGNSGVALRTCFGLLIISSLLSYLRY